MPPRFWDGGWAVAVLWGLNIRFLIYDKGGGGVGGWIRLKRGGGGMTPVYFLVDSRLDITLLFGLKYPSPRLSGGSGCCPS